MSVHTLIGDKQAAMYCSTSDWAFGPVFSDTKTHDAAERVESFLRFLKVDPRILDETELEKKYHEWRAQEDAQWLAELMAEAADDDTMQRTARWR
jgi:hypothetical protein